MAHASEADTASMPVTVVPAGSGQTIRQPGAGCAGASAATHEGATGSAPADSTITGAAAAPATMAAAAAATAALRPSTVGPRSGYAGSGACLTLAGAVWLLRNGSRPPVAAAQATMRGGWGLARVSPRRNQRHAPLPRLPAQPSPTVDHEVLTDFAGALQPQQGASAGPGHAEIAIRNVIYDMALLLSIVALQPSPYPAQKTSRVTLKLPQEELARTGGSAPLSVVEITIDRVRILGDMSGSANNIGYRQ